MTDTRNGDILPMQFMARREDWQDGVSLYLRQVTVGHGSMVAAPITMIKREMGQPVQPMAIVTIQTAQGLMDELWQCGLRPSEGTGSAGSLAATQRHLDDMRKLVFKIK